MKRFLKFIALAPVALIAILLIPSPRARQVSGTPTTANAFLGKLGLLPVGTPADTDSQHSVRCLRRRPVPRTTCPPARMPGPPAGPLITNSGASWRPSSPITPRQGWTPSLHLLLANRAQLRCGYSLALDHYEAAFSAVAGKSDPAARAIGAQAAGGVARMFMLVGRTSDYDALAASLAPLGLHPTGPDWGWAKEMRAWVGKHPDESFKCGLYCLDQLGRLTQPGQFLPRSVTEIHFSTNGYTAADLLAVGGNAGLRLHAALLTGTNSLPVPSILHLSSEHFVVLREQRGAFYEVLDPVAFGRRWLSAQDLAPEVSGCVLVSDASPPSGSAQLVPLDAATAASYRGRCHNPIPPDHQDNPCVPDDHHCCPPGGLGGGPWGGPSGPGGGGGGAGGPFHGPLVGCGGCSGGMPTYFISEAFLNLWLADTPLEYTSAYGPAVKLQLSFHDRNWPSIVSGALWQGACVSGTGGSYSFLGDGTWSCSWLSFAELDDAEATVDLMMPAGGWATFNFPSGSATSSANYRNDTWLEKQGSTGSITNLVLHFPDGSTSTYGVVDTSPQPAFEGIYYLSRMADPAGNATTFTYDSNFYLSTVTTADGASFSLQYGYSGAPSVITGVNASYGASVSFGQLTDPEGGVGLTNITDAAGISSQFGYEDGYVRGVITHLVTPYGTTLFSTSGNDGDHGVFDRTIQITNALGTQEFYGLINTYTNTDWPDFAPGVVPTNTPVGTLDTTNRQERNTFYWNAQQFAPLAGLDFNSFGWSQFKTARIRHWLASTFEYEGEGYTHFDTLSLEQAPSPDGGTTEGQTTWYDYAGKPAGANDEIGSQIMPSIIARVMPDGSTWYQYYQRLTNGLPTQVSEHWIDSGTALSRTNSYLYAANNTDLLAWTNALGIAAQVNIYNAYHQVRTNYDALGQMTTYTYDATTLNLPAPPIRRVSPPSMSTTAITACSGSRTSPSPARTAIPGTAMGPWPAIPTPAGSPSPIPGTDSTGLPASFTRTAPAAATAMTSSAACPIRTALEARPSWTSPPARTAWAIGLTSLTTPSGGASSKPTPTRSLRLTAIATAARSTP